MKFNAYAVYNNSDNWFILIYVIYYEIYLIVLYNSYIPT